ncbi:MAG: DUF2442 domain-containing protein [Alcanivorax sp.]|nr:DUF2442 domain-containing protein [Alcanivorax sp.]
MSRAHFQLKRLVVTGPETLRLRYADGEEFVLDMAPIIRRYPVLRALRSADVFATAKLVDGGRVVRWMGDEDLELAADNLRARAIEQSGKCSHEVVLNWMARHQLTLDDAADALGLSRRMLAYYRSGAKPVPRVVELAMTGWEHEHEAA